jgi:hypothetical protein
MDVVGRGLEKVGGGGVVEKKIKEDVCDEDKMKAGGQRKMELRRGIRARREG